MPAPKSLPLEIVVTNSISNPRSCVYSLPSFVGCCPAMPYIGPEPSIFQYDRNSLSADSIQIPIYVDLEEEGCSCLHCHKNDQCLCWQENRPCTVKCKKCNGSCFQHLAQLRDRQQSADSEGSKISGYSSEAGKAIFKFEDYVFSDP